MDSLFRYTGILLAIVLLALLIALLTGPYPWAVAFRRWVGDLGRGVGAAIGGKPLPETGRLRWIRDHRDGLMLAGGGARGRAAPVRRPLCLAFVVVGVLLASTSSRCGGSPRRRRRRTRGRRSRSGAWSGRLEPGRESRLPVVDDRGAHEQVLERGVPGADDAPEQPDRERGAQQGPEERPPERSRVPSASTTRSPSTVLPNVRPVLAHPIVRYAIRRIHPKVAWFRTESSGHVNARGRIRNRTPATAK